MVKKRPEVEPMRSVSAFLSQPNLLEVAESEPSATNLVPIDQIRLPTKQPRRYFAPDKMLTLVQSVRDHGILEPLLVRPVGLDQYELLAGERRLRAAQELCLSEVPIVSKEMGDREALQVSLIENLQREDLNPVEETEAILELLVLDLDVQAEDVVSILNQAANSRKRRIELTGNVSRQMDQIEKLLSSVGRFNAESFRSSRLPLLNLPEDVLDTLRQGRLEYTKARAIARVKDVDQRSKLLHDSLVKNLSLSQIREQVVGLKSATTEEVEPTMKQQLDQAYRSLVKSNIVDDPKKHRQLAKLLSQIESLLAED